MTVSSLLFNVVGGSNLTLHEVNEAAEIIKKAVDPDANIIFGVANDERMENNVRITLIATGFVTADTSSRIRDDALSTMLKGIKNDEELDVPSFLRRSVFSQRRGPIPNTKVISPQQPVKQFSNRTRVPIEQLVNED